MTLPRKPFEFGMYRESYAGGYSRYDCTVAFYTRIDALLHPDMILLNLGAGRGANVIQDFSPYRRKVQSFRGRVARVIGVDIDAVVAENPDLDEYHVLPLGRPLPLADASVDMVVSDHVLEHVADPVGYVAEVYRVLRPGGWFCARTPNRWGYIGLGARLIPNALHKRFLQLLQPTRLAEDVFPTMYLINTVNSLYRYFPPESWSHHSYGFNGVPSYHAHSAILFRLIEFWSWLMPPGFAAKYHVFIQKKDVEQ